MDPNLFHLDWGRTIEALVGVSVISFLVERVCALLFEARWWIRKFEDERVGKPPGAAESEECAEGIPEDDATEGAKPESAEAKPQKTEPKKTEPKKTEPKKTEPQKALPGYQYPLKEILSFLVALLICWSWDFDAVSMILLSETTKIVGILVTAAVIAGGSKASIALFHNVLKVRSSADEERRKLKDQKTKP